jgi:hypothetical protein
VVVERPICGAVVRLALVVVQARHARPSSLPLGLFLARRECSSGVLVWFTLPLPPSGTEMRR